MILLFLFCVLGWCQVEIIGPEVFISDFTGYNSVSLLPWKTGQVLIVQEVEFYSTVILDYKRLFVDTVTGNVTLDEKFSLNFQSYISFAPSIALLEDEEERFLVVSISTSFTFGPSLIYSAFIMRGRDGQFFQAGSSASFGSPNHYIFYPNNNDGAVSVLPGRNLAVFAYYNQASSLVQVVLDTSTDTPFVLLQNEVATLSYDAYFFVPKPDVAAISSDYYVLIWVSQHDYLLSDNETIGNFSDVYGQVFSAESWNAASEVFLVSSHHLVLEDINEAPVIIAFTPNHFGVTWTSKTPNETSPDYPGYDLCSGLFGRAFKFDPEDSSVVTVGDEVHLNGEVVIGCQIAGTAVMWPQSETEFVYVFSTFPTLLTNESVWVRSFTFDEKDGIRGKGEPLSIDGSDDLPDLFPVISPVSYNTALVVYFDNGYSLLGRVVQDPTIPEPSSSNSNVRYTGGALGVESYIF